MRKLKINITMQELNELTVSLDSWLNPDRIFKERKDTTVFLASLVLIELSQKLHRKLYGAANIKSYTFTPAEAIAFHIAYMTGNLDNYFLNTGIIFRIFQTIDQKKM